MTIRDLYQDNVEIQSEIVYCYYDYDSYERKMITQDEAKEKDIRYIYCENSKIFIEIDYE